jgi:hypothetical protein
VRKMHRKGRIRERRRVVELQRMRWVREDQLSNL